MSIEVTRSLLKRRDPKRQQRGILLAHEEQIRGWEGNFDGRTLILYGQHFASPEIVHGWLGVVDDLASGRKKSVEVARDMEEVVAEAESLKYTLSPSHFNWLYRRMGKGFAGSA